jgi:hypothetical protein
MSARTASFRLTSLTEAATQRTHAKRSGGNGSTGFTTRSQRWRIGLQRPLDGASGTRLPAVRFRRNTRRRPTTDD